MKLLNPAFFSAHPFRAITRAVLCALILTSCTPISPPTPLPSESTAPKAIEPTPPRPEEPTPPSTNDEVEILIEPFHFNERNDPSAAIDPSLLIQGDAAPDGSETNTFTQRPRYLPGELVDYVAQPGDTVPALAARFNTTEDQIMRNNPIIPVGATTMPPGFPMKIPISYRNPWGSAYQILPDALFAYGPYDASFNARAEVDRKPGWFKYYSTYVSGRNRRGGEIVQSIADDYSISPKLLLAILEYLTGALSEPRQPAEQKLTGVFGFPGVNSQSLNAQYNRLADYLNAAFYEYREGRMLTYELRDGQYYWADPWQNAASIALMQYFSRVLEPDAFFRAIGPDGFRRTYETLWGEIPPNAVTIEGSLTQPELRLPFEDNQSWAYTGGPHAAWGSSQPYAALDFAPPSSKTGCTPSDLWVVAPADGTVVRTATGLVILDLDGDGSERTGWNLLFLHLLTTSIPSTGTVVKTGDPLGHPSCDGGRSTGTHVHIARKYNGEWVSAGGILPFTLDGWHAEYGIGPYVGYLKRHSAIVIANSSADVSSLIHRGPAYVPTQTPTPKPRNAR